MHQRELSRTSGSRRSLAPQRPTVQARTPPLSTRGPLARTLQHSAGGGAPLAGAERERMGARFGWDLSAVRVHADPAAQHLTSAFGARALSWGHHVYLRPDVARDARPAAVGHELAHVVQFQDPAARGVARLPEAQPEGEAQSAPRDPAQVVRAAQSIAERLVAIAEAGQLASTDPGAEREASAASEEVSAGPVTTPLQQAPRGVGLLADLPGQTASAATQRYLQGLDIPLWHTIVGSPTLRPYDVEQAARAGTLTHFDQHPGSSFLGAVGEAIVWRNLGAWPMADAVAGAIYVFPNPGTRAVAITGVDPYTQGVIAGLLAAVSPDLLAVMFGVRSRMISNQHGLSHVVPPQGQRVQPRFSFGRGQTVLGFYEVTTSTQFRFLLQRAVRVAAWARARGGVNNATVRAVAVLAIDRGTYFNLTEAERLQLVNTACAAGAFIQLHNGLTGDALGRGRAVGSAL